MLVEECTKSLNKRIANMLTTLSDIDTISCRMQDTADEWRRQPTPAASLTQRLFEMYEELRQTEVEHQVLQKQMSALASNDEQLLEILMQSIHKLGCNLSISRDSADERTLFRFDFITNRYLMFGFENGQLTLLQISPAHPNFDNIKEFFSESQDLIGLLGSFGSAQ
ncbi:uncharacterized protein LOC133849136 [Drosophila sulfurigaster albostrigata]|uniref:uncharacterized protein LOC133849136 n=1 Tax=Drosophila sulfurigaster albostrigata TaxID=89887 RepID=UPI002D218BC9|nr:uncharacterized protein LOC133849136 [Drosophila sulfurigaster albostrigata]